MLLERDWVCNGFMASGAGSSTAAAGLRAGCIDLTNAGPGWRVPDSHVVLGSAQKLQDSVLWRLQDAFYEAMGARSWSEAVVPNFVTSNSHIARSYAAVIIGLANDLSRCVSISIFACHHGGHLCWWAVNDSTDLASQFALPLFRGVVRLTTLANAWRPDMQRYLQRFGIDAPLFIFLQRLLR